MRAEALLSLVLVATGAGTHSPPAELRVIFSADTRGALDACRACAESASPGLARRATLLATLRQHHPCVLLDAGNALHGRQSAATEGRAVVRAYEALGYDAIHLAVGDLLPSAARTRALVGESRVPFVSTNLVDAQGALLAAPWRVLERAGSRIGVLAVSEPPLPGALGAALLADQAVLDPEAALVKWLPEVRSRASRVLVLCAGTARWAEALRARLDTRVAALLHAGERPDLLPTSGVPPLVGAEPVGRALTEVVFAPEGSDTPPAVRSHAIPVSLAKAPDLEALLAAPRAQATPANALRQDGATTRPSPRVLVGLPLAAGASTRGELEATTAKLGLTVHGARVLAKYANRSAEPDDLFLVLDVALVNRRDLAVEREVESVDLVVLDLGAGLRLRRDGKDELALVPGAEDLPGHLPLHDVTLPFRGRPLRGNLVFAVPRATSQSLELLLRDEALGALAVRLAGDPTPPPAKPESTQEANPEPKPAPKEVAAPLVPRGIAGVGLTPEAIAAAIDKGAAFLWTRQRAIPVATAATEALRGHTTHLLTALALVHAELTTKDAACLEYVRGMLRGLRPASFDVYQAGVLCMLVESLGEAEFVPLARMATRYLVESQGKQGTWTYSAGVPAELVKDFDQRVLQVTGGLPLDATPRELLPCERTRELQDGEDGDTSCTQFALLGLRSASRLGIGIAADTWKRTRATVLARQTEDGGWSYQGPRDQTPTGSMTLAGICVLAITAHELGIADAGKEPAIAKALRWIDERFDVAANPNGGYRAYWRYGIERTGRILGTEFLGKHEWYPLGARFLVDSQNADGAWFDVQEEAVQDTAFGVLFLTRATPSLTIEVARGGAGKLLTAVLATPPARFHVVLDASGSMLEKIEGATKFDTAREALEKLVARLPDECEVGLRVYGHRTSALDSGADTDSELVLPLAPLDRARFTATLRNLRARGKTPLAFSIEAAVGDLGTGSTTTPTTFLLLTDGGEDPRSGRDPRAAAARVAALPGISFHVVGFDINRPDWSKQLLEVAKRGGGVYWPAGKREELEKSLAGTILRRPESFVVHDATGKQVARGGFGATLRLPEGRYRLVTSYGGKELATEFWINTDAETSVVFDGSKFGGRP